MPSLVPSRFNVPVSNGETPRYALYNTATGNYVVLDGELRQLYERIEAGDTPPPQGGLLYQAGFAIEDDIDEVAAIRQVFGTFRASRYSPHLTIAPTMDCNFGCEYCFESHRPGSISEPVQDRLLEFLMQLVEPRQGLDRLSVSWFGGEPLMALPAIRRLTREFLALCERGTLAGYNATIITNGSGLTASVCAELEALAIQRVQVTLDGPPATHDQRRFFKRTRAPTFERVVEQFALVPSGITLVVRMNVDRHNMGHAVALFEELERRGVLGRVLVDLARVENFGEGTTASALLSSREFAAFKSEMIDVCQRHGWPLMSQPPSPSLQGVCQVDSVNSFVVDPRGELFKCWAELGNGGEPVAHLNEPGSWTAIRQTSLTARDPFDDAECRSCSLLPTCLGSCPKTRDLNRRIRGKECPPYKHHFGQLVRARYGDTTSIQRMVRPKDPPIPA
jgi:uncharacterized protein